MKHRRIDLLLVAALSALLAVLLGAAPAHAGRSPRFLPGVLRLQTVPAMAGVSVSVDGTTADSDSQGRIAVPVRNFIDLESRIRIPPQRVTPNERVSFDRFRGNLDSASRGRVIMLGLDVVRRVHWSFVDLQGRPVPLKRISSMSLRSSTGQVVTLKGGQLGKPLWVRSGYVRQYTTGLLIKHLYWVVDSVRVEGAETVNKAQQKFVPGDRLSWRIRLMFYDMRVSGSDLLFGGHAGTGVDVRWTDGSVRHFPFAGADKRAVIRSVPRGSYKLTVTGLPVKVTRPVRISRSQDITLEVVTKLDVGVIGGVLVLIAVMLFLIGRRHRVRKLLGRGRRRWPPSGRRPWKRPRIRIPASRAQSEERRTPVLRAIVALAAAGMLATTVEPVSASATDSSPVPVFAYYYIWFTPNSWNRAKIDYPRVGRYSSDDAVVMRTQIRQAKAAGIDGFLVSWKNTLPLTRRLTTLAKVAAQEHFKLGIVYEALDFHRQRLPVRTVQDDLTFFANRFGKDPVFDAFGKPTAVWTGTERYTTAQLASVTRTVRSRLTVLASAKNTDDYVRVASLFDGDAYYWSSVNPAMRGYRQKLDAMSTAVHDHHGLWIAPAAPGFDARLVGGHQVVPRNDGGTLRAELDAARSSSPDALGIISWNEFSENTYVEPSKRYGSNSLHVLADVLDANPTAIDDPDSSSSPAQEARGLPAAGAIGVLVGGLALLTLVVVLRGRARARRL